MDLEVKDGTIVIKDKVLNELDKKVIDFVSLLNFDYVIMSGYISILFGRSRNTEDVDFFVDVDSKAAFYGFYDVLEKHGYYVINAQDKIEAYKFLVEEGMPLRIAEKDTFLPSFEIKLPSKDIDKLSLREKIKVVLDDHILNISQMELQIAFKLYLGSDKDYLDAIQLYGIYERYLDRKKLLSHLKYLGVNIKKAERLLQTKFGD